MPKLVDIEAQKQAIAEAAIRAIGDLGLENVRLRDVAAEAGATTGAVTHYFDGKDAVLLAAMEELVRRILDREAWRSSSAVTAEALIEGCCEILPLDADRRREWRVWLAFWARAIHDPRLADIHRAYYARITDTLSAVLTEAADLAPVHANLVADAVVAAVDGVGARATVEPDQWPPERQRRTLAALVAPLLAARPD